MCYGACCPGTLLPTATAWCALALAWITTLDAASRAHSTHVTSECLVMPVVTSQVSIRAILASACCTWRGYGCNGCVTSSSGQYGLRKDQHLCDFDVLVCCHHPPGARCRTSAVPSTSTVFHAAWRPRTSLRSAPRAHPSAFGSAL